MPGTIDGMKEAARLIDAANTGYDQWERWSFYDRATGTLRHTAEGDCSSVCGAIARMAGYPVNLSDEGGRFYTGTFKARMVAAGFAAIPYTRLSDLKAGDFVLAVGHVEFVPAPGRMFSARIDERGKATGGKAGDQTGREVSEVAAYEFSKGWQWVLRPPATAKPAPPVPSWYTVNTAKGVRLMGRTGPSTKHRIIHRRHRGFHLYAVRSITTSGRTWVETKYGTFYALDYLTKGKH